MGRAPHDRPGDHRRTGGDQHVHRVAVVGQGVRDEAVVAGIAHRRVQEAVDVDRARVLVELVLDRLAVQRNFDDDVDVPRRIAADGHLAQIHAPAPLSDWPGAVDLV